MIDLVAELRTLLLEDGDAVDETAAEPYDWRPGTLYVFPDPNLRETSIETGPTARQDFGIRAIYVFEAHEEAERQRDPAVSAAVDARLGRMLGVVRANRNTPPWHFLQAQADPRPPATLTSRAAAIRASGYRIVS